MRKWEQQNLPLPFPSSIKIPDYWTGTEEDIINRNFTSGQHVYPHSHPVKADVTIKVKGSTPVILSS